MNTYSRQSVVCFRERRLPPSVRRATVHVHKLRAVAGWLASWRHGRYRVPRVFADRKWRVTRPTRFVLTRDFGTRAQDECSASGQSLDASPSPMRCCKRVTLVGRPSVSCRHLGLVDSGCPRLPGSIGALLLPLLLLLSLLLLCCKGDSCSRGVDSRQVRPRVIRDA